MYEDFYPAAEKILKDIVQIIHKDPKLKTLEIITTTTNTNKSPVHHEQHSLGLESWCIRPVYCHAYQCVMNLRLNKQKHKDPDRLDLLLVGVLMINPDIQTFWNMRKDLINSGKLDPYFDLHFSEVVLSRKPKSSEVYGHRRWILNKILDGYHDKCQLLANEMQVCDLAADRYSNNYHAWTHRFWCLNKGISYQTNQLYSILQELNDSQVWISKHVSDYSGLQYRQQVLTLIFDQIPGKTNEIVNLFSKFDPAFEVFCTSQNVNVSFGSPSVKLAVYELVLNTEMIKNFLAHEALWYHRRFVLHRLKLCMDAERGTHQSNGDGVPSEKNKKLENPTYKLLSALNSFEISFIRQFETDQTDVMSKKYASRHQLWLSRHLKLNDSAP